MRCSFVASEVPTFGVSRLSFLFQKMLGQKRWVLPLLRPKTACWKTILTRQYTNGPRKPANWYSGFTWPATEVSWGTWRCCVQMHVTGQCLVHGCTRSSVANSSFLYGRPLWKQMFFFLYFSINEKHICSQFLYTAQQAKCLIGFSFSMPNQGWSKVNQPVNQ